MEDKNPFKFGSVVDGPYFTNRIKEIGLVKRVLAGENHLILVSPRRYGKTSLVFKVTSGLDRPVISIDFQVITSTEDLAAQILKRVYRVYPAERIRQSIRNFRVIPVITINPVSNDVEVSFQASGRAMPILEDVVHLVDKLGSKGKKPIVVFDEFQEARHIDKGLLSQLRSIMQHHGNVNYVFLGSHESAIKDIFESRKSPFYHFGMIQVLDKIPEKDFLEYLSVGLSSVTTEAEQLSERILSITQCHPYHTQKLAYMTWEICYKDSQSGQPELEAIDGLLRIHDTDYERWWNSQNKTDQKVITGMCLSDHPPLSEPFIREYDLGATSTAYSSLKRLMSQGIVIKQHKSYAIDDPVLIAWLRQRRNL